MTITHDREARETYESDYARLFDRSNKNWNGPLHNEAYLKAQERWMNDMLVARGHLFLNEAYDILGFPRIPQGQLIGWFRADQQSTRKVCLRLSETDDGAIRIEFNVITSDLMYDKI